MTPVQEPCRTFAWVPPSRGTGPEPALVLLYAEGYGALPAAFPLGETYFHDRRVTLPRTSHFRSQPYPASTHNWFLIRAAFLSET